LEVGTWELGVELVTIKTVEELERIRARMPTPKVFR
jgi:hypothetical protein